MRKILHIDLDAFYPSVEALDDPSLLGEPVIVGGLGPRGVVASASYEARQHGVHSAMPMAVARRLCPDAVYLRPRFWRYREVSRRVFDIYRAYTALVEPLSLDEAYLDVSARPEGGVELARSIKRRIHERTGLTASAGVAHNKLLAKLASDMNKPDGLTAIAPREADAVLHELPVDKLWGVGPATAQRLRDLGLETIGDVARHDESDLVRRFGKSGGRMARFARGVDERQVEPPGDPKSISSETTFDHDLPSWAPALPHLSDFAEELQGKLQGHELWARTVILKVRYADFRTITRSNTPGGALRDADSLLDEARRLMGRVEIGPRNRIRLVGLGVSNLVDDPEALEPRARQLTLWTPEELTGERPDA